MSTKKNVKTQKPEEIAVEFQTLDREIKALQAKQKPLKNALLSYAVEHKADFDEAFQLKFPNGTYISQRVKDVVEGTPEAKESLMFYDKAFIDTLKLNEKAVLEAAPTDNLLRKTLTKLGLSIGQKETFAVYAG